MSTALVLSAVLLAAAGDPDGGPAGPPAPNLGLELRLAAPAAQAVPVPLSGTRLALAGEAAPDPGGPAELAPPDRRTESLRRWERVLKWSTAGALVVTTTLGTLAAINQPTAFGDGRCQTGHPIFGTYGCDRGLSTLHGTSAVLSAILYTADGALALSIPGPVGHVSDAARPWHRALTYVHLGGMVVQPILGLVSAFPQVIGMSHSAPTDRFPRGMRTAHVIIGYVTTAAFLTTLALEW